MSRSPEQKIRLLVLYDILKSESDEERPLSTNELIEKLAEYGITATRQTIYSILLHIINGLYVTM